MEKQKKRNQIFNYLYVLAIIMVIDDHTSSRIGILTNIFPYNSFYMPLFVFISGYFYRKTSIKENLKHKACKLLLPYIIWNIIAEIVAFIIDNIFHFQWFKIPTIDNTVLMFFAMPLTSLNEPAWFVIMLFWVSILYNVIKNILDDTKINDILLTISFLIIGFITVYLCEKGYSRVWTFFLRTLFYMQFFHYGYMFNKYFEKVLQKQNKFIICSICVLINFILIRLYGDKINFYESYYMSSFSYWYLPLITSFTGIIFYYEIMEFLSKRIGQRKILDFIGRNTFTIMETHLFFINIPNLYVYSKILQGSKKYMGFDIYKFINSAWVRYSENTRLIGFFCGLIGSLFVVYLIEKIKNSLNKDKTIDIS